MNKSLTIALMLTATLGLSACDKKSEDKAQDAQEHSQAAQKDLDKAATEANKANQASDESAAAKAKEDAK